MSQLHVLTSRNVIIALLVSVSLAIAQCWVMYSWAGLSLTWSWPMVMGVSVLIIGWVMLGFWTAFPQSHDVRSRGMIRGLVGIFAGTMALTAHRAGALTKVTVVAIVVLLFLDVFWSLIFRARPQ